VVDLSPAELESLNELIHIDHYYVKQQPQNLDNEECVAPTETSDSVVVTTSSAELAHRLEGSPDCVKVEMHMPSSPSVQASDMEVEVKTSISPLSESSMSTDSHQGCLNFLEPKVLHNGDTLAIPDFASLSSEESPNTIDTLSTPDVENSLPFNFLDQLDLSGADVPITDFFTETSNRFINTSDSYSEVKDSKITGPDLNTSKFISELEDYLKYSSSTSPSYADSDPFSEGAPEAFSPQSSEGSLLDDLPWQDSFTELFPGLQ
jgi:hypothetical protein